MTFKMLNKSVSSRNSENATPVTIDEMTMIERRYRDKAEYYANRLRDYLHANTTLFPLFLNSGSTSDTIFPQDVQVFGGIYLPDNDCEERYYFIRP
jgi:hypothetical protein